MSIENKKAVKIAGFRLQATDHCAATLLSEEARGDRLSQIELLV